MASYIANAIGRILGLSSRPSNNRSQRGRNRADRNGERRGRARDRSSSSPPRVRYRVAPGYSVPWDSDSDSDDTDSSSEFGESEESLPLHPRRRLSLDCMPSRSRSRSRSLARHPPPFRRLRSPSPSSRSLSRSGRMDVSTVPLGGPPYVPPYEFAGLTRLSWLPEDHPLRPQPRMVGPFPSPNHHVHTSRGRRRDSSEEEEGEPRSRGPSPTFDLTDARMNRYRPVDSYMRRAAVMLQDFRQARVRVENAHARMRANRHQAHPQFHRRRLANGHLLPVNVFAHNVYFQTESASNYVEALVREAFPTGAPPPHSWMEVGLPEDDGVIELNVVYGPEDFDQPHPLDGMTTTQLARLLEQEDEPAVPPTSRGALALLRRKYLLTSDQGEDGKMLCGICLEEKRVGAQVTVLPCRHYFDKDCIETWLLQCGSCPTCRRVVEET